jgi:hypothetical protein
MHVMQYEIRLPAGYDMDIIDRRVATHGSRTDDFAGLGLKAYAVRRAGRHGSLVNAYAPFYLWNSPAGMNAFLYGPFRSITTDFGRPVVRHWAGAAFHRGPEFGGRPVFATRETTLLPPDVEPGPALDTAPPARTEGLHSQAVAVDPDRWEVVRFTLWSRVPPSIADDVTAFDVPHLSASELGDLPTGRLW